MSETIKTPPKSGAKLFVAGSTRDKIRCQLCDKEITDRAIAVASHARSHVRAGTVEESGHYGSREWRIK